MFPSRSVNDLWRLLVPSSLSDCFGCNLCNRREEVFQNPALAGLDLYGAAGSRRDLMSAAVVVRSMLGVSPSAYQDACEVMGPDNGAATIACILERAGHITSAGGYLRDLTAKARRGEFSLGPVIMTLMRASPVVVKRGARLFVDIFWNTPLTYALQTTVFLYALHTYPIIFRQERFDDRQV